MIANLLNPLRVGWSRLANLPAIVLVPLAIASASLTATGGTVLLRQIGALQRFELSAYDQMVRFRPDHQPDPRLLVVAITEADIKAQKRWPLSDETVAAALQRLQQYQPRVIGLDLYREIPHEPGNAALAKQLQQPNVIAITKMPDPEDLGVQPPPSVPLDRVGFNDIPIDPDGVVRRSLLFADVPPGSSIGATTVGEGDVLTFYSFALQVTLTYLKPEGISPEQGRVNENNLRLKDVEYFPLTRTDGQYQTIDDRGYQILLNYRRQRGIANQVTLTQVLNGSLKPEQVRDKIVLIGTTARSAKDIFLTPYSSAEQEAPSMPGVFIHAQTVSSLLSQVLDRQPMLWFWADWVEVGWIGGWALIGGCLAWFARHPIALTLSATIAVSALLGSGYVSLLHQGWIPVAAPLTSLAATATIVVVHRAQQAQRQQQMVMKLLGQNTSPAIATTLWKSRDRLLKSGKLPGQRLTATMLFTDIRNFSTISEEMAPEDLLEWLNEYLSDMTQEVQANQGIINKFTGDGLLAVFGVPMNRTTPIEVSHDAQLAVSCALAMGDRLNQLNRDWQQRGLPQIQMRVGIFTGPIVVGSLGGKDRLEYGVIGDSVNIASRLEGYEKQRQSELCRVLIAEDTLKHLQHKFVVESWGPAALKGKNQLVEVYRVLGYARDAAPMNSSDSAAIDAPSQPPQPLSSERSS